MNVLVTGGAGYMGCHTVADLLRESLGHLARWLKYILAFTHLTTEKGMPLREMDSVTVKAVAPAVCCSVFTADRENYPLPPIETTRKKGGDEL